MELSQWVTVHWLRFAEPQGTDALDLSAQPQGAASWKIGPDSGLAPDFSLLPSDIWCGVGLFAESADAERAMAEPEAFMPFLSATTEAWHAMLMPVAHRGACNHLDRAAPGPMLAPQAPDPGGPVVAITSAGFDLGPGFNPARVIDFRANVERLRVIGRNAEGSFATQVFTPVTRGDDGLNISIWRDDESLVAYAYRPGEHRDEIERYKREKTVDRTSFTRLRAVATAGTWDGECPIARARDAATRPLFPWDAPADETVPAERQTSE